MSKRKENDNNSGGFSSPKPRRALHDRNASTDQNDANDQKLFNFLGKIIFVPISYKIGFYLLALLIFSTIKDYEYAPSTYFESKKNVFNVYLAKYAWGWTLAVLVPFIIMTSFALSNGSFKRVGKSMLRVFVATALWFSWTSLFENIDRSTGRCTNADLLTKTVCKTSKHEWIDSFDISGHTFLLIYALLFIHEEVQVFGECKQCGDKEKSLVKTLSPLIKINFFLIACLTLLWNVILVSTFLYHHTLSHKLIAALIALISWYFSYGFYFSNRSLPLSPGLPTDVVKK
jgi:hypothetical protein